MFWEIKISAQEINRHKRQLNLPKCAPITNKLAHRRQKQRETTVKGQKRTKTDNKGKKRTEMEKRTELRPLENFHVMAQHTTYRWSWKAQMSM